MIANTVYPKVKSIIHKNNKYNNKTTQHSIFIFDINIYIYIYTTSTTLP